MRKKLKLWKKAAHLADDYSLTHKVSFVSKANPRKQVYPPSGPKPSPSFQSGNSNQNAPKPKLPGENKGHNPLSQPICNYCKQSGHIVGSETFEGIYFEKYSEGLRYCLTIFSLP